MTKKELNDMLIENLEEYRKEGIWESVKRNSHMNGLPKHVLEVGIPQEIMDSILVDFINFVARFQGVDLGLYTKDLKDLKNEKGENK